MVAEIHALAPEPEEAPDVSGASVIRLKSKPKGREKRVILFYIDDVAYSVPSKPGAETGLQYLDIVANRGQEIGIAFMLKTMLGDDGYKALLNYRDLDPADLQAVIVKASEIMNGAMEAPKGS
jgi:hypothetical protein